MEIEQGGRRELCAHAVQDHNTGDQFIVAVDLSRCQQEPNSLENAYMDVTVCDGRNVWRGEGKSKADPRHRLSHRPIASTRSHFATLHSQG